MITRAREVGRLIEVRRIPPIEPVDFDEAAIAAWMQLIRSVERPVVCIDLRQALVLPPQLADNLAQLQGRSRGIYERVANILAPSTSPTLLMQLERLARTANDPTRRIFTEVNAAIHWLDEVLNPLERARLRVFLGQ